MALIDDLDLVTAARKLAYDAHRDQRYGDRPYTTHLLAVANVLFEFSCWTPDLLAAARHVKVINCEGWNVFVENVYGRPYNLQQQGDCLRI